MSVESMREPAGAGQWENSDEIDLSRYVHALGSRWLEIVLTTVAVLLLTAIAIVAYRVLMPPVYEATATAAIIRTSTDVVFDERFTTTSEEPNLDVNSRRLALIALVRNSSIAQQVIDELGDQLPENLRTPEDILEVVEGDMAMVDGRSGQSDLINITVRTDSPDLSAAIANAWAQTYVSQVNSIYGQVPDDMLASVEAQLAEAQQGYAEAQVRLEDHLATSQLTELNRQYSALSRNLDVQNSSNDIQLRTYYDQWLRTSNLLTAARSLAEQASGDETSAGEAAGVAGTALALQMLKLQMVNAAAVSPPQLDKANEPVQQEQQQSTVLQLQLDAAAPVDAATLRTQIADTIASLETQLARLEAAITETSQSLMTGSTSATAASSAAAAIPQMEEQLRLLQSQIEVETAHRLEWTQQRDLAWESVKALSNKQAELRLARAAANSEVRLSNIVVPLDKPVEQVSLAVSLALAAVVGLALGVAVAIVLHFMQIRPLRASRVAA